MTRRHFRSRAPQAKAAVPDYPLARPNDDGVRSVLARFAVPT